MCLLFHSYYHASHHQKYHSTSHNRISTIITIFIPLKSSFHKFYGSMNSRLLLLLAEDPPAPFTTSRSASLPFPNHSSLVDSIDTLCRLHLSHQCPHPITNLLLANTIARMLSAPCLEASLPSTRAEILLERPRRSTLEPNHAIYHGRIYASYPVHTRL